MQLTVAVSCLSQELYEGEDIYINDHLYTGYCLFRSSNSIRWVIKLISSTSCVQSRLALGHDNFVKPLLHSVWLVPVVHAVLYLKILPQDRSVVAQTEH